MERWKRCVLDAGITVMVLFGSFCLVLFAQKLFHTQIMGPMIFVLATFLVALSTQGYAWGILTSLASVLVVNYAFRVPYFEFNFSIPENLFTALVMLFVAFMTSTLTTKIKAQEKMRRISELEKMRANLLRAISHDLRTPLTAIYGACSTIIDNYDLLQKQQQLKLLGQMREDTQWLIGMVENLLSVTRIDGGNVSLVKTPIVLEELIDTVLVKFQKRYPGQQVELDIPGSFTSIPMDALLIEQVLINLLDNAMQHAEGMTRLSLRVFTRGDWAVFEVADDGCGIPRDKLSGIFSGSVSQASPPGDGGRRNMGIGLSVCAAIVRAHGGEIQAENRSGGGAVFRFSLQMEASEHEQQQV